MRERQALGLIVATSAMASIFALAISGGSSPLTSMVALGAVCLATGLAVFVVDGGRRPTPAGVFYLSVAVFLGAAMVYLAALGSDSEPTTVLLVGALSHGAMLVTLVLYRRWTRRSEYRLEPQYVWKPAVGGRGVLAATSGGLVFTALILAELGVFGALPGALGYAGLALSAATFITTRPALGSGVGALSRAVPLILVGLFVWQTFTGSGRLIVTGLVLMLIFAVGMSRPTAALKAAVVVALLPALIWAGAVDQDGLASSGDASTVVLAEGAGLESLYGPLDSLAQIRERELDSSRSAVPRQLGATFWATAVVWVPRDLWDDKPLGWGAVLAETLSPQYRDGVTGHSDTALLTGEFYANFGVVGLLLLPAPLAAILAWLRRVESGFVRQSAISQRQLVRLAALFAAVASLSELFWGGTHSWAARGGMGAGLLLLLSFGFSNTVPPTSSEPHTSMPRSVNRS